MTPEAVTNTTAIMQTRQPEKRKVDSSILFLTTTFILLDLHKRRSERLVISGCK